MLNREPWDTFISVSVQSHTSLGLTNILHHDLSYRLNFGLQGQTELWLNPADLSVPDFRSPCQTHSSLNCNERNRFPQIYSSHQLAQSDHYGWVIEHNEIRLLSCDCHHSISQALEDFSKPMTCRKQPIWFKPLVTVTQDRSCERSKRNLCACTCTKASLWVFVCVFVSMLGPQKAREAVLGRRLLCSAFQNTTFRPHSTGFMWIQKCEQAQNTSEDPLNQRPEDVWSKTKKIIHFSCSLDGEQT